MADTPEISEQTPKEQGEKTDEKPSEEVDLEEEDDDDAWKAEKYRTKVVERIQDEITKTESQVPKSAMELEEFVFSKAKSRKGYRDLVARLLIYVSDFNKKKGGGGEKEGKDDEGAEKGEEETSKTDPESSKGDQS